jgi:hypothetical protein
MSYDLSRFGDQLICARNSFSKRDWKEFGKWMKRIPWVKYFGIIVRHPDLFFSKLRLFSYFRIFKAN